MSAGSTQPIRALKVSYSRARRRTAAAEGVEFAPEPLRFHLGGQARLRFAFECLAVVLGLSLGGEPGRRFPLGLSLGGEPGRRFPLGLSLGGKSGRRFLLGLSLRSQAGR